MSKAWEVLGSEETKDGVLELRRRDADDCLICIDGRVLMNSRASRSEEQLGKEACLGLRDGARVLVGGLGMGFTLRAILDVLPPQSEIVVAELHPVIESWCRGPIANLSHDALADPRVEVRIGDVADRIREGAVAGALYDAIVMDLFEGPHAKTHPDRDPLYGRKAVDASFKALRKGGVLAVWAEAPDRGFESRLTTRGFRVETRRPGKGGLKHWIVLARK